MKTLCQNEGIKVQEAQSCLFCGRQGVFLYQKLRDRLFEVPGIWSLMYCPICDLAWLDPQPVADDIGKLYTRYYTHQIENFTTKRKKKLANLRKAVKTKILRDNFGYSVETKGGLLCQVLSRIGLVKEIVGGSVRYLRAYEKGCLLDVGCGNGKFLVQMRELGWEVMGVEPDPEAVRIARDRFGLEVVQGTLEEAEFPNDSFDAITMNHVIEHALDPIGLFAECRRILKPGGKLVVITPNIKSIGARLFGQYWRGWEVPRHLFLFSPKSLWMCAKQAELKVQKLRTIAKSARWMWATSCLIKGNGKLPGGSPKRVTLELKLKGIVFWMVEYVMSRIWHMGEELVLEATK